MGRDQAVRSTPSEHRRRGSRRFPRHWASATLATGVAWVLLTTLWTPGSPSANLSTPQNGPPAILAEGIHSSGGTPTFPYGNVSIAVALPNLSLSRGEAVQVDYRFEVSSWPKGVTSIAFDLPSEQVSFPRSGGSSLIVWIFGASFNVTGTSWVGGNTTSAQSVVSSSNTSFVNGSRAVMSSELLAIMDSVPWGKAPITFEWSWAVLASSGGPTVASGSSALRSIEPQEYVSVVSDGPGQISPGQNFTVCVGGSTIRNRTLSLHMEVPNPYYAFAWNSTHIPGNATAPWCWSVQMPTWFHELPTPLLVHIWSYATQPGILYVLHTEGVPRSSGTLAGHVVPADAAVNLSGLPITVDAHGNYRATVGVGTFWLAASAPGYSSTGRSVTILNGTTTWANLTLTAALGRIAGTVSPSNASVFWNGSSVPVLDGAFSDPVAAGDYQITATAPERSNVSSLVSVQPGQTTWTNLSLPWGIGWLSGTVRPYNATVLLDGAPLSTRYGAFTVGVTPGNHTVAVSARGFANWTGTETVAAGSTTNVTVRLLALRPAPRYSLVFTEQGLPGGTRWTVELNGTTSASAAGGAVSFELPNGTYPVSFSAVGSYLPRDPPSSVVVSGHALAQRISFASSVPALAAPKYAITFGESGLPPGTDWSATIDGGSYDARGQSSFVVELANGTYPYTVAPVAGFTANGTSGTVRLQGAPVFVWTSFTRTETRGIGDTPTPSAPSSPVALLAAVIGIGAVAGGLAVLARYRWRGRRS